MVRMGYDVTAAYPQFMNLMNSTKYIFKTNGFSICFSNTVM